MKIKTSELEGYVLDVLVHQADGCHYFLSVKLVMDGSSPSTNWAQGGPLIERYRVMVEPLTRMDHPEGGWHAGFKDKIGVRHGSTPLIAAMRAIVASELGDEVDVPEELIK